MSLEDITTAKISKTDSLEKLNWENSDKSGIWRLVEPLLDEQNKIKDDLDNLHENIVVAQAGDISQVQIVTSDLETMTFSSGSATFAMLGGVGIDTSQAGTSVTISGKNASSIAKGIAQFSSSNFSVSSGDVSLADDITIAGNLTVDGTTTTINSTTLTVDDKNIEMGVVDTPTDATADGGGITLKGATDKTILWDNANDNWTSNQDLNLDTGKVFRVNNVSTLTATTLGSSVVNSSLTSVGELEGLTMAGTIEIDGNDITNIGGFTFEVMDNGALSISTIDGGSSLGTSQST